MILPEQPEPKGNMMAGQSLSTVDTELAALHAAWDLQENDSVRHRIQGARQTLADSSSVASAADYRYSASGAVAAAWFGSITVEVGMLALVAEQTSTRTGTELTGMEKILLIEARSLRGLKSPDTINAWLDARSTRHTAVPDPRAFDAIPVIYAQALGGARVLLADVLRVLERVAAPFL
jgi:hypothetical protein